MLIRQDEKGLYIRARGYPYSKDHYRPGGVNGYDHAYRMHDGNLKAGDSPKTKHVEGTPLVRITLDTGQTLYWAAESQHNRYGK